MPSKTQAGAAALAAGAIAAGIAVLPANGQAPPASRTVVYTSTESRSDFNAIDSAPKGDSVGDRFVFSSTLRRAATRAGRIEADCVAVDKRYEGLMCAITVLLGDGRLTLQGVGLDKPVAGVGRAPEQYVITAGTGAYAGVTGTMRRRGDGKRDTLTLTLSGPTA